MEIPPAPSSRDPVKPLVLETHGDGDHWALPAPAWRKETPLHLDLHHPVGTSPTGRRLRGGADLPKDARCAEAGRL